MAFPVTRLRRLRGSPQIRAMVREKRLDVSNLVMPLFVVPGRGVEKEISAMPGQMHLSVDKAVEKAKALSDLGVPAVLLFAIPEYKDDTGSSAWRDDGIIQQAVAAMKESVPGLCVITDLCFCEYTSHGHCGIMQGECLHNDETLDIIQKQTLSHARAGADMIAPSGMIDGAVGAIRRALDENHFVDTTIMGYSAKFASAFYGPFREAVQSAPSFGDRKTYQMDPANLDQALREVELDIQEGADIVMVKPAMAFLDVVYAVKQRFGVPTAVYNVSGEYSMIKAAAAKGWIDEDRIVRETLLSMRRAGADIIITYFAEDIARARSRGESLE